MKKTIKVTQEHIDKGVRLDPCKCPVALAIREQTIWCPRVNADTIWMSDSNHAMPKGVETWVRAFDGGSKVGPLEFELDVPAATD